MANCNKYNLKIPLTLYLGLLNIIPNSCKVKIKRAPSRSQELRQREGNISTNKVYSILLNEIFEPPTAETKILRHREYELPFRVENDITMTILATKVSALPS